MIIVGDIGGTKTNIALFETDGKKLGANIIERSYPSKQFDSLNAILEEFIGDRRLPIGHACFGVAGPVVEGHVETSNLVWDVDAHKLAETLKLEHVNLINDLEATAYGIEALDSAQLYALSEGDDSPLGGHRALIAAGTGLGMAGLFWDGQRYHPISSEGGHIDFAPRTELEIELLRYLSKKIGGHVSYERTLSGPGLFNIYSFLRDTGFAEEPAWLASTIASGDPSAAVSAAALSNKSPLAVKALDMFVEIYGAMAGNLALLLKPTGGVYIGGGIAPKIIDKLKDGSFMRSYRDKGRLSYVIESIPVHVILDDRAALYGAALYALLRRDS